MTHAANASLDIRLAFIALGTTNGERQKSLNQEKLLLVVQNTLKLN